MAHALLNNLNIYKEVAPDSKIDLILEWNTKIYRCQIKSFFKNKRDNSKTVAVRSMTHSRTRNKTSHYSMQDVDYFIAVDVDTFEIFVLPISYVQKYRSSISKNTLPDNYKNQFNFMEPFSRNTISAQPQVGEALTSDVDGNPELAEDVSLSTLNRASVETLRVAAKGKDA